MTEKQAIQFIQKTFGEFLVKVDGPAGTYGWLFVYDKPEGIYISSIINKIILELIND